MKILHITPVFYPKLGGIETFTLALIRSLQARGHENRVVVSHSAAALPDTDEVDGIPIDRVPFLPALAARDPKGVLLSRLRLARVKQAFGADIIHLHIGGPMAFLYLQTEDISPAPLVITAYDLPTEPLPSLNAALDKAALIAAISEVRMDECRALAPQAAGRTRLVYTSLPDRMRPTALEKTPAPTFFMVGRQVEIKGFDISIAAFEKVHKVLPEARLVLAGDGPEHENLQAQVRRAGLEGIVLLPGRISDEELSDWYDSAWATLVPSLHSESFGLVALEAMQAGCAVVASRIGGLQEVVRNGETGELFPAGNPDALAEILIRLGRNPQLAFDLGAAGRHRAANVFGWDTCVDHYEKIYVEVK